MLQLAMVATILGAVLGFRHSVLVLLPILGIVLVGAMFRTMSSGLDLSGAASAFAVCYMAIQLGYLGGAFLRQIKADQKRRALARSLDEPA